MKASRAAARALPVYQPERVRRPEAVELLRALAPDAMVVVGYGQIIPQSRDRYRAARHHQRARARCCPNIAAPAPIQWAIAQRRNAHRRHHHAHRRGPRHRRHAAQGARPKSARKKPRSNWAARLAVMGADLLVETLAGLNRGRIVPEKQDAAQATYAPILKKEDGLIDWTQPRRGHPQSRARPCSPGPAPTRTFAARALHIWRAASEADPAASGTTRAGWPRIPTLVEAPASWPAASGALELSEVQLEGRKRMSAADFANGQRLDRK